jgi:hypothetical protein
MLAPSLALRRLLARRVHRCQEGHRPEKYRDTQGWCQGPELLQAAMGCAR